MDRESVVAYVCRGRQPFRGQCDGGSSGSLRGPLPREPGVRFDPAYVTDPTPQPPLIDREQIRKNSAIPGLKPESAESQFSMERVGDIFQRLPKFQGRLRFQTIVGRNLDGEVEQ